MVTTLSICEASVSGTGKRPEEVTRLLLCRWNGANMYGHSVLYYVWRNQAAFTHSTSEILSCPYLFSLLGAVSRTRLFTLLIPDKYSAL